MKEKLYYIASAPFESARQVSILPTDHPSSRLHGHSFRARIRTQMPESAFDDLDLLEGKLVGAVSPLNYDLLNNHLDVPTDENLSRYLRQAIGLDFVDTIGVQSTQHQGADLDRDNNAHIWRRFRFEAAHRLPQVPEGHPCGTMHGHGFEVVLHAYENIAGQDMGTDFDDLDKLWAPIHRALHHKCLNDIEGLKNPTSELIAKWIWERLAPDFQALSCVSVFETVTAGCHYDGAEYRIWKEQRFESAVRRRSLKSTDGRSGLHGHSYLTRLHLTAELDQLLGWTVDYGDVKEVFRPIYDQLDHQPIHEIASLEDTDTGSILKWIKAQMSNRLPQLDRVDLFESPSRGATLCWARQPIVAL